MRLPLNAAEQGLNLDGGGNAAPLFTEHAPQASILIGLTVVYQIQTQNHVLSLLGVDQIIRN